MSLARRSTSSRASGAPPLDRRNLLLKNLRDYEEDAGGSWCKGIAIAAAMVYEAMGIEAAVLCFGKNAAVTHATTVVRYHGMWIVQDAYLNFEFVNGDGTSKGVHQVITDLKSGALSTVEAIATDRRDLHYPASFYDNGKAPYGIAENHPRALEKLKWARDGRFIVARPHLWFYSYFLEHY